ncbi:MAG: oligosaccharide flippase family protein [Saccharofermentans sp.]|nr:oligosaccharide flippase family protein [Saccharofermentans sp.]
MDKKYRTLFTDALVFALGSLGSKLILFFLVPIYTNYLTTDEYGIADLVFTFVQLIVPFATVSIQNSLIRFGMEKNANKEETLKCSMAVILFSVVFTLAVTPLVGLYSAISDWKWYLAILVVLNGLSEVERSYLKVRDKNKSFAVISIIQTAVLAGCNILLLVVFRSGVSGYLLSNIIAVAVVCVITFFAAGIPKALRSAKLNVPLLKKMVVFSMPLVLSAISWWVVHSSDRIMIELMIGESVLGLYTAATKIPSLINVVTSIFNQAWGLSSIREIDNPDKQHFYSKVFRMFSTALFMACIMLITVLKPFLSVYFGADFRSAWVYTPLLLVAAVFFSLTAFIGSLYIALQKSLNDMITYLICAFVNVVVNFVGILFLGAWGAVIGTVTAFAVVLVIRIFDIKRYIDLNIGGVRFFLNAVIALAQAVCVSMDVYVYPVSAVAIVLFVALNYKEIARFITSLTKTVFKNK